MTDRRVELIVGGVLLIAGLAYIGVMSTYPYRARIVPIIVTVVMLGAVVWDLVSTAMTGRRRKGVGEDGRAQDGKNVSGGAAADDREFVDVFRGESGRRLAFIAGWTVLFLLAVRAFGFAPAAGIWTLVFFLLNRVRLVTAIITSAVIGLGTYALLELLLNIPATDGFLFDAVVSVSEAAATVRSQ